MLQRELERGLGRLFQPAGSAVAFFAPAGSAQWVAAGPARYKLLHA